MYDSCTKNKTFWTEFLNASKKILCALLLLNFKFGNY